MWRVIYDEAGRIVSLVCGPKPTKQSHASGPNSTLLRRKVFLQLSAAVERVAGMALQVLIAHTGQRLQTDPAAFASLVPGHHSLHLLHVPFPANKPSPPSSLDAFKAWVAQQTAIAATDHIALTTQGKAARFQTLVTEVGARGNISN